MLDGLCSTGLEIGAKNQSHVLSGKDVQVNSSHNFETGREVSVVRATTLIVFATVMVLNQALHNCD